MPADAVFVLQNHLLTLVKSRLVATTMSVEVPRQKNIDLALGQDSRFMNMVTANAIDTAHSPYHLSSIIPNWL